MPLREVESHYSAYIQSFYRLHDDCNGNSATVNYNNDNNNNVTWRLKAGIVELEQTSIAR
jgi:hypothetical protein